MQLRAVTKEDASVLYEYLLNPNVRMFSRLRPENAKEMEEIIAFVQHQSDSIVRVIANEWNEPIGLIALWEYCLFQKYGFLATWIAEEHWGKGYNQMAKELFFSEMFIEHGLENIFIIIRNYNKRSLKAIQKIPSISLASKDEEKLLRSLHKSIEKDHFLYVSRKETYLSVLEAEVAL